MNKQEIQTKADQMYDHINKAYDLAEDLRDSFSGIKDEFDKRILKDHCNKIRSAIYNVRDEKGKFVRQIRDMVPGATPE